MAKKWTPTEEKFLLENYGKVPMSELAERFGVTRKAISAKLDKLRGAYGIRPVGARDRGPEPKVATPPAPTIPRQSASAVRRPRPLRPILSPPSIESADTAAYGSKVPSGLFIKTEDGWKPILMDREKIAQ
jgi:hypothetical protein